MANIYSEAQRKAAQRYSSPAMEDALKEILINSGIDPGKHAILSNKLTQIDQIYSVLKFMKKIPSVRTLKKLCHDISALISELERILELEEIKILLAEFGAACDTTETLHRIDHAARQAGALIIKTHDEIDEPIEYQLPRNSDALLVIFASMADRRGKGNKRTAETALFSVLRNLFMYLGGTDKIGSTALYQFVKACTCVIDKEIRVPKPEPFRVRMMYTVKQSFPRP